MDENTDLILTTAAQPEHWEDQEKSTDDLQVLQREFGKRLYSRRAQQAAQARVKEAQKLSGQADASCK